MKGGDRGAVFITGWVEIQTIKINFHLGVGPMAVNFYLEFRAIGL